MTESSGIVPDHDARKEDLPAIDPPSIETASFDAAEPETPEAQMPKAEAFEMEASEVGAAKPEAPRAPSPLLIMSPGERSWDSRMAEPQLGSEPQPEAAGKRRFAAMAAVAALAMVAGAAGGALATIGVRHFAQVRAAASQQATLEASVAHIDAEIVALKAGLERATKLAKSQFNTTSDRIDKIEKAQIEPAVKLAKLSEAVDKLRAKPPAAVSESAASATPKDVTGSVTPPSGAAALPMPAAAHEPAAPKTEVGRLPTVQDWVLRDVGHGAALIEGRRGLYEVYAGDPVPGLGRVDAIRRQDGRWVVVTSKGLIVAR